MGRTVLVTGASSGIGREIAALLAGQGLALVLACRDAATGEQAAAGIRAAHPGVPVAVHQVDLARPAAVRALAEVLRAEGVRLDVLVNNAGVHLEQRRLSADGLELTFATNVLGYFCASLELLDLLEAGAPARGGRAARIVNVASTFATAPDLEDLQFAQRRYTGRTAYAQSKACNRMLTRALTRRLAGRGVTVNAMAPGLVQTRLFRDTPVPVRLAIRAAGLCFGRTVAQGADTAAWLAVDEAVEGVSGSFFERRAERPCVFRDTAREERLWRICAEAAGREPWPLP